MFTKALKIFAIHFPVCLRTGSVDSMHNTMTLYADRGLVWLGDPSLSTAQSPSASTTCRPSVVILYLANQSQERN